MFGYEPKGRGFESLLAHQQTSLNATAFRLFFFCNHWFFYPLFVKPSVDLLQREQPLGIAVGEGSKGCLPQVEGLEVAALGLIGHVVGVVGAKEHPVRPRQRHQKP